MVIFQSRNIQGPTSAEFDLINRHKIQWVFLSMMLYGPPCLSNQDFPFTV